MSLRSILVALARHDRRTPRRSLARSPAEKLARCGAVSGAATPTEGKERPCPRRNDPALGHLAHAPCPGGAHRDVCCRGDTRSAHLHRHDDCRLHRHRRDRRGDVVGRHRRHRRRFIRWPRARATGTVGSLCRRPDLVPVRDTPYAERTHGGRRRCRDDPGRIFVHRPRAELAELVTEQSGEVDMAAIEPTPAAPCSSSCTRARSVPSRLPRSSVLGGEDRRASSMARPRCSWKGRSSTTMSSRCTYVADGYSRASPRHPYTRGWLSTECAESSS